MTVSESSESWRTASLTTLRGNCFPDWVFTRPGLSALVWVRRGPIQLPVLREDHPRGNSSRRTSPYPCRWVSDIRLRNSRRIGLVRHDHFAQSAWSRTEFPVSEVIRVCRGPSIGGRTVRQTIAAGFRSLRSRLRAGHRSLVGILARDRLCHRS